MDVEQTMDYVAHDEAAISQSEGEKARRGREMGDPSWHEVRLR